MILPFFSKVLDLDKSVTKLNTDLQKISQWANHWKMKFNPDPKKQTHEVIFSCKLVSNNLPHLLVKFNNNNNTRSSPQKHLRVVLNSNLNCNTHIDQKIKKSNKIIGLVRRLAVKLPHNALLTIYKSFIRPYFHYGNILYDKPNNENFQKKKWEKFNIQLA